MKKLSFIALSIALLLLSGCSSKDSSQPAPSEAPALQAATEAAAPSSSGGDSYVGRTVKMSGTAACLSNPETNQLYYACIIADATGCCAQGLEYVLPDGEPYPEVDASITVTGTFALYYENGFKCFHLVDATLTD